MGFDELADFGTKVNGLNIDDLLDRFCGDCGDVGGRGLGIDEEDMAALDGAKPPCCAGERFVADGDTICLEQGHKLFEYSLLIHYRLAPTLVVGVIARP